MDLTRKSWPGGWNPSVDKLNPDPSSLLRMDNLTLDKDGTISLTKGINKINVTEFENAVVDCFSRTIDTTKYRYAGLYNGKVLRSSGDFSSSLEILSGGGNRTAFSTALGQVLICSGSQCKKDDGTNVYNLGVEVPPGPPVVTVNQPFVNAGSVLTLAQDAITDTIYTEDESFIPVKNLLDVGAAADRFFDDDGFVVNCRIPDTTKLESVSVEFWMDTEDNYFKYTWYNTAENSPFTQGVDAWSSLSCKRGDFERAGSNAALWWDNVSRFKATVVSTEAFPGGASDCLVGDCKFLGGSGGPLDGVYEWVQVNVYNNGVYTAKSAMGPIGTPVYVKNGYVDIEPQDPTDPQVNEIWFYRRTNIENLDWAPGVLDKFYRTAICYRDGSGLFSMVSDNMSDEDAIKLNVTLNEYLVGVKDNGDDIWGIEALYFDRALYLTVNSLLLSEPLNIDAVDTRFSIRVSGDPTEKCLWVVKVSNGILLLGTTKEIYEISGSLAENPDGTIDANIRPIGESHPPIAQAYCKDATGVIYVAEDGWRITTGSHSELLSYQLRSLFDGETCHGIPAVHIGVNNTSIYSCAVSSGELFTAQPMGDGSRYVFCYDIVKKYWYLRETDPFCFFTEEDGTLLAGYGGGSGNYLREFNTGTTIDGSTGQSIEFRTIFDDNGQPRNRKDSFTLKITADTGDLPVSIQVAKNGRDYVGLGSVSFDGHTEFLVTIAETVGLGKNFSLRIVGDNLTTFKLWQFTIEYDPRPEQLTYIRIPYNNLGTQSRKRFINYAFVIDTMGEDCEFFPLIDGVVAGPSSIVNLDRKGTYIHYFVPTGANGDEYKGIDIGGIICGFFEFYGPNLEEIVSEKLPVSTKYLIIPANDYGEPNRKRHSSYKFQIDTRGKNVSFTPEIDGVFYATSTANTSKKRTHEHFFTSDTIGIDIGGILQSLEDTAFEFYGVIKPQQIELLPPRLKEFRIPENNYGIAAKKRIRTMPMEINTNGYDVTFTPIVDGVSYTPTVLNTATRATAFHYFSTDIFGVDYSGELVGTQPFEFYGLLKPEEVEILPVGKKFDQIGPIRLDKLGKLLALRIRGIFTDTLIPIKIKTERDVTIPDASLAAVEYSANMPTIANVDDVYELLLPKTINGTIFRLEIGPTTYPFHRYSVLYKANVSGMEASPKWIEAK